MTSKSDYQDHSLDELKDFLRERDLQVSGTKDELVDRLVKADKAEAKTTSAQPEDIYAVPERPPTEEQKAAAAAPEPMPAPPLGGEPVKDTKCEGSGAEFPNSPVPEEQRHPAACPVCGKNFDLEPLDPEDAAPDPDIVPDHDDIRLVPEEPMDLEAEPEDEGRRASKR